MKIQIIKLFNLILLSILFLQKNIASGQSRIREGRGAEPYEGPLPDGEDVEKYSLYAIGLLFGGILLIGLAKLFGNKDKDTTASNFFGCFASLLIPAGLFCLIPLFMWLQIIVQSVVSLIILGFIALIIISILWNYLKK